MTAGEIPIARNDWPSSPPLQTAASPSSARPEYGGPSGASEPAGDNPSAWTQRGRCYDDISTGRCARTGRAALGPKLATGCVLEPAYEASGVDDRLRLAAICFGK